VAPDELALGEDVALERLEHAWRLKPSEAAIPRKKGLQDVFPGRPARHRDCWTFVVSMPNVFVGVSGYDYAEWRGSFYPAAMPRSAWLDYARESFDSIELNGTFYSLKTPAAYERWAAAATDGFVYAVKGSGFITHRLRLKGAVKALANFYASGVLALGRYTGPFLWQLPPRMRFDPSRLEPFLATLPRDTEEAE
jgi:uncharacterized protein YecE (DUF72 family)